MHLQREKGSSRYPGCRSLRSLALGYRLSLLRRSRDGLQPSSTPPMGLILWKQSAAQHIVTVYRTAISNNIHDNINNGDNKQGCTSCSDCRLIITRQHKQRRQLTRLFKLFRLSSFIIWVVVYNRLLYTTTKTTVVTIQRMLPFPYRRSRTAVGAHKRLLANEKKV